MSRLLRQSCSRSSVCYATHWARGSLDETLMAWSRSARCQLDQRGATWVIAKTPVPGLSRRVRGSPGDLLTITRYHPDTHPPCEHEEIDGLAGGWPKPSPLLPSFSATTHAVLHIQ